MKNTPEAIEARAYDLFLERNGTPGNPVEDWLKAEEELRQITPDPAFGSKPGKKVARAGSNRINY